MKRSATLHLNVIRAAHIACYCSPPCSRPSAAPPSVSFIGHLKRVVIVIANAVKQSALSQQLKTTASQFPGLPLVLGEVGIRGGGK